MNLNKLDLSFVDLTSLLMFALNRNKLQELEEKGIFL